MPRSVSRVFASSPLAITSPPLGTSPAKARNECSTSARSLKKSRWSASTSRITATVGKKFKNELQYSQLSRMIVSPLPTRWPACSSGRKPPIITVGSFPASRKMCVSMEVVVVLPCVPETQTALR